MGRKTTLVRTNHLMPEASALEAVRAFLFGAIEGLSEDDKTAWHKFWGGVLKLEAGEIFNLEMAFPRNGAFHRKFFVLLKIGFEAWEPEAVFYNGFALQKNFEKFRADVLIAAGFYEANFDLNGQVKLSAQSISFAKMDELTFENLYSKVVDVFLQKLLANYKNRAAVDRVVDRILGMI